MKVERLEFDRDRMCSSTVGNQTVNYRSRINQDFDCRLKARFRIDGKFYCDRHAGLMVLDFAVKKGEI